MSPGLVDAHCHLSSERLAATPEATLAEARAVGVSDLVLAGVDPACWARQAELAREHSGVHPVFGIHPWVAAELTEPERDAMLAELLARVTGQKPPVAIGETGLDSSPLAPAESLAAQAVSFRAHLALARRYDLPVVLHILRAHGEALRLLRTEPLPERRGFVHSYSGSAELVREYTGLGFAISYCGTITHPQSRRLRAAAACTPPEKLLAETDTPDQTPTPHRGEKNRPALLPLVVAALAKARGETSEAVARATAANARALLALDAPR